MKSIVRSVFVLFFITVLGLGLFAWWAFQPAGPNTETFVEIVPGSSARRIGHELESAGIIRSRFAWDALRALKGGTLKAGEYRFDHPERVEEVYERIARGDVYTIALTVPEGANLFDIAARAEAAHLGMAVDFLSSARTKASLVHDLDPRAESLEGYLFPDTYHFSRKVTTDHMLETMVRRFRTVASRLGLTENSHEVVTLASIVERETPMATERPLVASVFSNRLKHNMPLMTDPTVIYALLLDGRYRGTIYLSDLSFESPYNTYRHVGLPPGPICNPGEASLVAALHPAESEYLYFVAESTNPSGRSKFAKTLEEHQKNVESYRKAQRAAGLRK